MNETENRTEPALTQAGRWKRIWPALFCLVTAAAFLTICTKSSPLYPMNDWVDVNIYFTVGRKMAGGSVLYRDIFDHKGPLLYFVYALIGRLSPHSFTGVFVMEIVCCSLFLYFCGKCAGLYLKNRGLICALLLLLSAAVMTSDAFMHGGSVEEMCLFLPVWSLYLVLRTVREKRPFTGREAFAVGLAASVVFWVKYTMCGAFLGMVVFTALYYLVGLRQPKKLLSAIGWFLLGLVPVTAAVLLYFIVNGAAADLFQVYFYDNLFLYSGAEMKTRTSMITAALENSARTWSRNGVFMTLGALGVAAALAALRKRLWEALAVLLPLPALGFFVLGGGYSRYYGLYYAVFSIFGLIVLGAAVQRLAEKRPHALPKAAGVCLCAALGAGMLFCAYRTSPNVYLMQYEKEDMPQYKFAEIIDQEPGATLLNYAFLDGGFYYASGVDPVFKYFFLPNLRPPEVVAEQNRYMRFLMADFVVTRGEWGKSLVEAALGYTLIAQAELEYEQEMFSYYLYHRD